MRELRETVPEVLEVDAGASAPHYVPWYAWYAPGRGVGGSPMPSVSDLMRTSVANTVSTAQAAVSAASGGSSSGGGFGGGFSGCGGRRGRLAASAAQCGGPAAVGTARFPAPPGPASASSPRSRHPAVAPPRLAPAQLPPPRFPLSPSPRPSASAPPPPGPVSASSLPAPPSPRRPPPGSHPAPPNRPPGRFPVGDCVRVPPSASRTFASRARFANSHGFALRYRANPALPRHGDFVDLGKRKPA